MTTHARNLRILAAFAALAVLPACGMFAGEDTRHVVVVPPPPPPPQAPLMAPQAAPQMPMAQAPAPMAPSPMQAPPAQAMGAALAGHLASYRTAESAQAGWQQLVRAQPALQTLRPYYIPVTINGQPWVRLLAGDFPNAEEVNRFCNWARANRMYCMPMPVAGAAQPNAGIPQAAPAQRQRQPRGAPQGSAPMAPAQPAPAMAPGMAPAAPAPQSAAPIAPPPATAQPAAPTQAAPQPAANQPPQPLAPPLPARRQPQNPSLPQ